MIIQMSLHRLLSLVCGPGTSNMPIPRKNMHLQLVSKPSNGDRTRIAQIQNYFVCSFIDYDVVRHYRTSLLIVSYRGTCEPLFCYIILYYVAQYGFCAWVYSHFLIYCNVIILFKTLLTAINNDRTQRNLRIQETLRHALTSTVCTEVWWSVYTQRDQ